MFGFDRQKNEGISAWFRAHTLQTFAHGKVRVVEPKIVLEVAFDNVQISPRCKSGFAQQFPRIVRVRDGKSVEEINTPETVQRSANNSSHTAHESRLGVIQDFYSAFPFARIATMSVLSNFLSSRLRSTGEQQFVVARSKMSASQMPEGTRLIKRKIIGPRVIVKDRRYYGNVRSLKALWPQAGLGEWENHKIVYVLDGHIDFPIGNYAVQGGAGLCLVLPPGTPQATADLPYHAAGGFCDLLQIVLHPHAIQCFITNARHDQSSAICSENYLFKSHRLAEIFRFLTEEIIEGLNNSNRIGADLLSAFWLTLQRELAEGHYVNPGPLHRPMELREKEATDTDFKTELLHYVRARLNQSLTLESVARGLYLSRTQFVRRVRKETGKSFVEFLTEYRIEEAKTLLQDSDWTIAAIAAFLGFTTPAYFHVVFQRNVGETPGQFRKRGSKE